MNALFDFFSPEAGQRRRAALNEFGRDIGYYVPPELRGILGLVAEATPTATIDRASAASMRAADPTRTASQRIGDVGNMLSEVAGVVAPAAVANRAAMPTAQALQEGLLGFSVGAQDAGRAIVDRLNQPGPVPTMYSNPVFAPLDIGRGAAPADLAPQRPYEMSGEEIAARLEDVPTAAEVAGREVLPAGANFSALKGQRSTILPQHSSAGFLSNETTPPVQADWQSLAGRTLFGLVGDPTARKTVTRLGEQELINPVVSQAGFEFPDIEDWGWASAQGAMASKFNAANAAENPYFVSLNMAEKSGDFADHTGLLVGEAFRVAPIASRNVAEIDDAIRNIGVSVTEPVLRADGTPELTAKGNPKTRSSTIRPFADFQSVADPDYVAEYIASLPTGTLRAGFVKGLDKKNLQDMGVPNAGDIRLALANPDMIGRDWLTAGYRGFEPDIEAGLMPTTPDIHRTYDTMIRKLGQAQTFDQGGRGVPANLLFRDLSEAQRAKGTGGGLIPTSADYKVYESSPYRGQQFMDDQAVELVSTFTEIENRFGRRAALQYANELLSGGKITGQMIEAARRANAPSWMLAALAPTAGLLNMETEGSE